MTDALPLQVVKAAVDLTAIGTLAAELEEQATHLANDRLMPGGRALVSVAPVASVAAYAAQVERAEAAWTEYATAVDLAPEDMPDYTADEDPDWEPPLQTLLFWSERWRAHHHIELTDGRRPTLASETSFLRWALNWAAENDPRWDAFVDDVATARRRLEDTLHAGSRTERTRVECDREACTRHPRLLKIRAPRKPGGYRCTQCGTEHPTDIDTDHCPNPWCWTICPPEPVWTSDSRNDFYKCPACKAKYSDRDYRQAYAKQMRRETAAKYVSLRDAIATLVALGRSDRTIRSWLASPIRHVKDRCPDCVKTWPVDSWDTCPQCGGDLQPVQRGNPDAIVEAYCDTRTHTAWVWWPDLWRLHLSTPSRKRQRAG